MNRTERGVHYARYYTFTMSQAGTATINLDSSTDPYLILLSGRGKNGKFVTDNDDINFVTEGSPLNNFNSEISRALDAGDYVIEATTYESQSTGDFTLTVVTPDLLAAQIDAAVAMIGALHGKVLQNTTYTTAQTALANCLSPSDGATGQSASVPTFDEILENYNTHKSKMESGGECASQATAMFTALRSASKSELAKLKADNPGYATLLSTSHGRAFEANVSNADIIKLYATLASPQVSEDSGASSNGDTRDSGASGTSATATPTPVATPRTGLNCVSDGETVGSFSTSDKIEALNCLVFDTPHSPFWVNQSSKNNSNNDFATNRGRFWWVGLGDWECSFIPDNTAIRPACLKHDVSYSTLKKIINNRPANTPEGQDFIQDSTWNPRNKYLADVKLYRDLMQIAETWTGRPPTNCNSIFSSSTLSLDYRLATTHYLTCKATESPSKHNLIAEQADLMWWGLRNVPYGQPPSWVETPSIIADVALRPHYVEYP